MRDVKALIAQMTLEEKAGMCSGKDFWRLKSVPRLGIPEVMVSDGPHGLRKQDEKGDHLGINDSIKAVCFPTASATAASFDRELLHRLGDALGQECQAENVSVLLGPAINIKRSPLCGRNFEYFSEDPYLAGELSAAQIQGVQQHHVGTSVKHFAANNQEYMRLTCSSNMDERTLREIYLSAFEIAVKKAKPYTMMCSYNRINGEYASENEFLLNNILREEWGFDGYVMSDWGAVNDRVKGLKAGLELEMPGCGGCTDEEIVQAVKNGSLEESVLDRAVERILNIVFRFADNREEQTFDREQHHHLAVELEKECAVLLKNDGILPLSRQSKIAYIGGFAQTPRFQGGGSSHINSTKAPGALEISQSKGEVSFALGFPHDKDEADSNLFQQAVQTAAQADIAVVFAGLPDSFESEGYDRSHMEIPQCQNQLIEEILKVQLNVVVVLHNGSPIELPWADKVKGILEMYLGGQGVGEATDALLFGEANPSGHLPETFPLKLEDNPSFLNFPGDGTNVTYAEGVFVGYRYYEKKKMPVRFPFGHGLSYTTFAYSDLTLSQSSMKDADSVTVSVTVTNTGTRAGKAVVQLYIKDTTNATNRPEKELKGFEKVLLQPGESKVVSMELNSRSLSWYNESLGDWYAASGTYEILIGQSSQDIYLTGKLEFETEKELPFTITMNTTMAQLLAHPKLVQAAKEFAKDFSPTGNDNESDAAASAITAEMAQQMFLASPLRGLRSFSGVPTQKLLDKIEEFNQLLQK